MRAGHAPRRRRACWRLDRSACCAHAHARLIAHRRTRAGTASRARAPALMRSPLSLPSPQTKTGDKKKDK
jgi:hypothetical protein